MKKAVFSSKSANNKEYKKQDVRIAKSLYKKSISKQVTSVISYTILALFVVYICFAATIMRVIPTATNLGLVPVKNLTYSGGIVPIGKKILVDKNADQGSAFVDHLRQSIIPSDGATLIEVKAGPYGKINWAESGLTTVNGKPLPVTLANNPGKNYLTNEYIGECIKGACTEGEGLLFSAKNIYGQPLFKK